MEAKSRLSLLNLIKKSVDPVVAWLPFITQRNTQNTIVLALINLFLGIGSSIGLIASNALLVTHLGTEVLFYVYLGSSIISILSSALFFLIVDKLPRRQGLFIIYLLFSIVLILSWVLLTKNIGTNFLYYMLRMGFYSVFILCTMQFWLQVSEFFTNLEAKVRSPFLIASSILGWIIGSILLNRFANQFHTINFILLWGVCIGIAPLFSIFFKAPHLSRSSIQAKRDLLVEEEETRIKHPADPKELIGVMFTFWACYTFLGYGVDYFYNDFAVKVFSDENLLASFFAKVALFALISVFIYQLFFASRLIRFFGIDQLIYGMIILIASAIIAVYFYPSLLTVIIAEAAIVYFIDFTAVALFQPIFNTFPTEIRGRAKVIIEGLGRPLGSLILLALSIFLISKFNINLLITVIFLMVIAFFIYPVLFSKIYFKYLVSCLKDPDEHIMINAIQALGERNKIRAAKPLLKLLKGARKLNLKKNIILSLGKMKSDLAFREIINLFYTKDESLQISVIQSLSFYRDYKSIIALFQLLKSKSNVTIRVKQNAIIILTRLTGKKIIPFLLDSLTDPDDRIKANVIESLGILKDKKTIPILLPFLQSTNNRIKTNAAIALYRFRNTRKLSEATIADLIQAKDKLSLLSALFAIGELKLDRYKNLLDKMLHNLDKRILEHASVALAKLGDPNFVEAFLSLLLDPDEKVAIHAGRHLISFPYFSRTLLFEKISELASKEVLLIVSRLDQLPYDFTEEKEMLLFYHALESNLPL